jgi:hypothetical protein
MRRIKDLYIEKEAMSVLLDTAKDPPGLGTKQWRELVERMRNDPVYCFAVEANQAPQSLLLPISVVLVAVLFRYLAFATGRKSRRRRVRTAAVPPNKAVAARATAVGDQTVTRIKVQMARMLPAAAASRSSVMYASARPYVPSVV